MSKPLLTPNTGPPYDESVPLDPKYLKQTKPKTAMMSFQASKQVLKLLKSHGVNLSAVCSAALDGVYLSSVVVEPQTRVRRTGIEMNKDQYKSVTFRYSVTRREALVERGHNISDICRSALDRVASDL